MRSKKWTRESTAAAKSVTNPSSLQGCRRTPRRAPASNTRCEFFCYTGNDMGSNFARVFGAQPALPFAHLVSVEADLARGLHAFSIVGLPDKAVEEARDRVASAIKNSGLTSPKSTNKKIVISLAPAELKKEGSAFDLAVALSYLLAAEEIFFDPDKKLFAGELA